MVHAELLVDGMFIGGPCDQAVPKGPVRSPWDGAVVGTTAEATWAETDAALDAAARAFPAWRSTSAAERQGLLLRIADLVDERAHELVDLAVREIGKPVTWARAEVRRMAVTFRLGAKLLDETGPQALDLTYDERGAAFEGFVTRFPIGAVLAVTPYNWPYNLSAHKIAPALAAGNTVVFKASPQASLCSLSLARLIHDAGCPAGVVNAVNCGAAETQRAIRDPRVAMVSFTGADAVGWDIKAAVPEKRVTLELGGDASLIIEPDANLELAVQQAVSSGFGYAGQVCISTQHVLVHKSVFDTVHGALQEATLACPTGDPRQDSTICGPLISRVAADRVESWIEEAVSAGAARLAGGLRDGNTMSPTLLEDVPTTCRLATEEVFGPVLTLASYSTVEEAVARVNRSKYGLQCSVFTNSAPTMESVYRTLDVGTLVINDSPSVRFDGMPYGGRKRSGFGLEGVEYAYHEMTDPKVRLARRL